MSLSSCIRKLGKSLSTRDAEAIQSLADSAEAAGMPRAEAEEKAIQSHLSNLARLRKTKTDTLSPSQDFGNVELSEEVTIGTSGEVVTIKEGAQRKYEQMRKRRDVLSKLKECLGG